MINWVELEFHREHFDLSKVNMSKVLGVSTSTYNRWQSKGQAPRSIELHIDALESCGPDSLVRIIKERTGVSVDIIHQHEIPEKIAIIANESLRSIMAEWSDND